MAKVYSLSCDLCESTRDVATVVVQHDSKWSIDLCGKCYRVNLGKLEKAGEPVVTRRRRTFEVVQPIG